MHEQKDNQLVLFRNHKKRPDKRDPDYRGQGTAMGVPMWVDAWISQSKDKATKYMSIRLRPKTPQPNAQQATQDEPPDIPF